MAGVRELGPGEARLAAAAMLVLRPQFGSADAIAERMEAQLAAGYRLAAAFEEGRDDAAAVAGFRIAENLAWGRFCYVDDLVTHPDHRGRGHADAVVGWVAGVARERGCGELHLDSGVGTEREDAHRFYFRHGMRIASYHFSRSLD